MEKQNRLRASVYRLLEPQSNQEKDTSFWSRSCDIFLVTLISINVLAVILETMPSLNHRFGYYFTLLELFSVGVFTLEYILRTWTCVEAPEKATVTHAQRRWKFARSPMAIIDLIAILPFYLAFIVPIDLRFLRILRLLRIFKLTRYSAAMTTLLEVLRDEARNFFAAITIMFVIMVIAASCIYMVEHDAQPDAFGSIPQSMWWAIVTLTTVGYGDVTPVTAVGKLFAAVIMIVGVGLVALPTGILASSFSEHISRKRETLSKQVSVALEDGIIDQDEELRLQKLSEKLGVSKRALQEIKKDLSSNTGQQTHAAISNCPHCGKNIHSPTTADGSNTNKANNDK